MSKVGRPSKGVRDAITAKPPLEFSLILKENATKAGLSYGEYLVFLASEQLGLPQYAPKPSRDRANEIPGFTEAEVSATAAA